MALCMDEETGSFDPRLLLYIEEGKSTVVKKMLEASGKFCDLVDSHGSTLLHYAARFGNVNVLQYLLDSGSEVDAQENHGYTPLMLAVLTRRRKTIFKLLEAEASIDIKNQFGENALILGFQFLYLFNRRTINRKLGMNYRKTIVNRLLLKLKRDCFKDNQSMAKRLLEANCHLDWAVRLLKNTMVTDAMLKSGAIRPRELVSAFFAAIRIADVPHVKLFMENGALEACGEESPFQSYLFSPVNTPQELEILEILLRNFDNARSQADKLYILARCSRDIMKILLDYIDLRKEMNDWSRMNTYLHGFMSNPNEDIVKELPVGVNFDFHKLNSIGDSYLIKAARVCNVSTIEFLLGKGVRVNSVNTLGYNALMMAIPGDPSLHKKKLKIVNILLKHGAEIQYTDETRDTSVFDFAVPKNIVMLKPIVAHVAMLESLGKPITQLVYDEIESYPMLKSHFKLCKARLERMKRITIHKSVTLYKLLTEREARVMLYVQNEEFSDRFNRMMQGRRRSNAYYDFLLRRRIFECIRAAQLKRKAGVALTGILQIVNHTVTSRVLEYLSVDDWKNLQSVR